MATEIYLIGGGKFDPSNPAIFTSGVDDMLYTHQLSNKIVDHQTQLFAAQDEALIADRRLDKIRANPDKPFDVEIVNSSLQEKIEAALADKFINKPHDWIKETAAIVVQTFNEAMHTPAEKVTDLIGDKSVNYADSIEKLNKDLFSKHGMRLDDIVAIQTPDKNFDSGNIDDICKAVRKFIDEGPENSGIKLLNTTELARLSHNAMPRFDMPLQQRGYDSQEVRDEQRARTAVAGMNR